MVESRAVLLSEGDTLEEGLDFFRDDLLLGGLFKLDAFVFLGNGLDHSSQSSSEEVPVLLFVVLDSELHQGLVNFNGVRIREVLSEGSNVLSGKRNHVFKVVFDVPS